MARRLSKVSNLGSIEIKTSNLTKSFGDRVVLNELNLRVDSGEFASIVGRNGCGKNTFLRLVGGLEKLSSGKLFLDEDEVNGVNSNARIMFQDSRLPPWKTVMENVALGLPRESYDLALGALKEVGLGSRAGEWPSNLSDGQKQGVALACALVHKPELLLLDEPLGALDALTRIEMQTLIKKIWQEHKFAVLLVAHDVNEAVILSDRAVLTECGKITLDLKINLPRQGERGTQEFAKLEANILSRILENMYYI